MSRIARRQRHERERVVEQRGQALVEFALVLPLVLILIFGVIDLGKALGYKNDETNIASQAARLAVVSSGTSCQPCTGTQTIGDYVLSTAPNELLNGTGSITAPATVTFRFPRMISPINSADPGYCKGDPVEVTVSAHYSFLGFLLGQGALPGVGVDITSRATMRMETNYDTTALGSNRKFVSNPTATSGPICP